MQLGQLVVPQHVLLASWEQLCPFYLRRLIKPWKTHKTLVRKVLQTIPFMGVAVVGWLVLGSQLLSLTAVSQPWGWAESLCCILAVQQIANSLC